MKHERVYIAADVEMTGPVPGMFSMLSYGLSLVSDPEDVFYRELQPLNLNYVEEAFRIGALHLDGLKQMKDDPNWTSYNPKSKEFNPRKALTHLQLVSASPREAMLAGREWTLERAKERKTIMVSDPANFDQGILQWYFHTFLGQPDKNGTYHDPCPFHFAGEDVGSLYKGIRKNLRAYPSFNRKKHQGVQIRKHHAGDDAKELAYITRDVLGMISK